MDLQTRTPQMPVVDGAIRNPANPDHFMVVQPVDHRVQIHIDGVPVADSDKALRVVEIGGHVYQPRIYIPVVDITADLVRTDKVTHCPLKGDAAYFSIGGTQAAWRYDTFKFANVLDGHLSFMGKGLVITEGA